MGKTGKKRKWHEAEAPGDAEIASASGAEDGAARKAAKAARKAAKAARKAATATGMAADEAAGEAAAGATSSGDKERTRPHKRQRVDSDSSDADVERGAVVERATTGYAESSKKEKKRKEATRRGEEHAASASELPVERTAAKAKHDADLTLALTTASPEAVEQEHTSAMVQVGGGRYLEFEDPGLMSMHSAALLKALAADDSFRKKLAGVEPSECTVRVGSSVSEESPTPMEEEAAVELKGSRRLQKLVHGLARIDNLFIRVQLPAAPVSAADALLRDGASVEDVYALLAPLAKAAVDAARAHRSSLAAVRGLKNLTPALKPAEARDLGITVLRAVDGVVRVGMLDIPPINGKIVPAPKTFDDLSVKPQKLLLQPQRLERAFELVDAVDRGLPLGVLLSGPNGVGKSAAALLAYLVCAARGLPAVYISEAETWVDEARAKGGGDAFLLQMFWRQNADLIIEKPALREVFVDVLHGAPNPFTKRVIKALRELVRTSALPGLAVICDEVQNITAEVKTSERPTAPESVVEAGRYFATNWHSWTNANSDVFQRMSVASAHAERDTKLPDGEMHRLRIMEPLHPDDRAALQAHPMSPAYVKDAATRERVVFIAGNMLRKLVVAANLLPRDMAPTKTDMNALWETMWVSMEMDCSAWLASLPERERATAAHTVMQLVSGKVPWGGATSLYDWGIVFRLADPRNSFLRPVSAVASAVLLNVTSRYICNTRKRLSSLPDGRERGLELERQVLATLDSFASQHGVPAKLLDGSPAPYLDLRCSYSLPFAELSEVVARDVPILYRPVSGIFACVGIRMPAAEDADGKICLVECSTADPVSAERVRKVLKWYGPGGVAVQLAALSGRKVAVALFYDRLLPSRVRSSLSDEAQALSWGKAVSAAPVVGVAAGGAGVRVGSDSAAAFTLDVDGTTASASAALPARKASASRTAALEPLGDATCVVDLSSLIAPLGLLV